MNRRTRDVLACTFVLCLLAVGHSQGQSSSIIVNTMVVNYLLTQQSDCSSQSTCASIVGRYLFYNNSAFDNYNPQADTNDDAAIALDKTALRPGFLSTFDNYSSYISGINGIMIDIADLPAQSNITIQDFIFKTGNNSFPASWPDAPAPSSINFRRGQGIDNSDRITLIWPDGSIKSRWLQVTLLASENTSLNNDDIFYFGNAPGETGNNSSNCLTNATDEIASRNNPRNFLKPADISNPYDHNRDQKVDATDQIIARNHNTTFSNALQLFAKPIYNPQKILPAVNALSNRIVDFIGIGDSNQLFDGHGWDHGFQFALIDAGYPMYATGLISAGENNLTGQGTGYYYRFSAGGVSILSTSEAPASLDKFLNKPTPDFGPMDYAYLAIGDLTTPNNGLALDCNDLDVLGVLSTLRFQLHYGGFSTGGGSFQPQIRRGSSPWTTYLLSPRVDSNTGSETMNLFQLDLPANTIDITQPVNFRWQRPASSTGAAHAKVFITWQRIINLERTHGFAYTTLYGNGGQSAYDMAAAILAMSDQAIDHFFDALTQHQRDRDLDELAIVIINSGFNDRKETHQPSLGSGGYTIPDSADAYRDNLQAIITRLQNRWNALNYPNDGLYFLVIPSHPLNPNDDELIAYRAAANQLSDNNQRSAVLHIPAMITSQQMAELGYYHEQQESNAHLSIQGYEQISRLVIQHLSEIQQ